MKTIAFYSNQLSIRGTEIALYTYADYNEKILGNKSIIFSLHSRDQAAYQKFANRFDVTLFSHFCAGTIEEKCKQLNVDYFYVIKEGTNDGYVLENIPTLVHAVFCKNDPHGARYAYVSDWLAEHMGYSAETHSVPHIVEPMPNIAEDTRTELSIPNDAIVFGCYGGSTEFNIADAHRAVEYTAKTNKNVYFVFMNINKFCEDHSQIIHLPGSYDLNVKRKFINTCNAMLHARQHGETFGFAVAEFSMCNKPIVTYGNSGESNHLKVLGHKAIVYVGYDDLIHILNNHNNCILYNDYSQLYSRFAPEIVMRKFEKVFLT